RYLCEFTFLCNAEFRALLSFPTRRSSDLAAWLAAGIGWALVAGVPAGADDTEIFFVDPDNIENKPNILFILDNSLSMEDMVVSQSPYDPSVTYPDVGCAGDRKSTRLNSSHVKTSYAVFCLKKKRHPLSIAVRLAFLAGRSD